MFIEKETNISRSESFDVLHFLARLSDVQKNEKEELERFRKEKLQMKEMKKIFDEMSIIEKRMLVMISNLKEDELAYLFSHADEITSFGMHDLPTTLNHLSMLTGDYRYSKAASEISPDIIKKYSAKKS
jgi:hypothetical protein